MKTVFATAIITLMTSVAFAQAPDSLTPSDRTSAGEESLATPSGHEVSAGIASYNYREPGTNEISIHGPRFVTDYQGTLAVSKERHWFAQGQARATVGNVTYDGFCSPFLITPDSSSPNGYALDVGDPSPCSESGDKDWYLEARGLTGKDFIAHSWAWSPYTGLGVRHLSNGTTGTSGYRTDNYLYLPVGITARTKGPSFGAVSVNVEYDHLLRGWQKTRDSKLGGGDVPATDTAPAFTIEGFSDISFDQSSGWALRANAKFPVTRRLSLEPYYVHWNVKASPVSYETVVFTVNNVTAREQLGAYEPDNLTNEFGIKLGFRF